MGIGWIIGGALCALIALFGIVRLATESDPSLAVGSVVSIIIFGLGSAALFVAGRRRRLRRP